MRWPFTGREAELRRVADALGGDSGGVVIAGSAGVGKTRLVAEAASLADGCAVEWARATRSARSIPLGAFAALLPPTGLPEGVELLARARHALAERADGRRLVLCVDDGQLLDDASAALVHQLVAAGEAFVVVSLRRDDEPPPDALRALWKDDLCVLLELGELARADVETLLHGALGGPVDGRTLAALYERTRGNALFLRELVRHGVEHGELTHDGGVWRWRGEITAGARLAEMVDLHVEDIAPAARGALELVAVAAPLEAALIEPAALEALERSELVARRSDDRRRFVDVAHPMHGEAVRARMATTRAEQIQAQLAQAVEGFGARRSGDELRIAVWRLAAGGGDAALLTRAAEQAIVAADMPLAERLARAAVHAGAGFRARLTVARAIANTGRPAEAEALLADLEPRDDRERAAVAMTSARNLFWALDRADDADAVLRAAEERIADEALRHELIAQRVRFTAGQGRPPAALAAARPLLADAGVNERARTTVALGAIEALLSSGRADAAVALAEEYLPVSRRLRDELPHAEAVLLGMRALALRLAGHLTEATAYSEDAYARLLARRSAIGSAVEANSLGLIWLARGRVRTALRFCRESAAILRDGDSVGMLAFALAGVAQAAAQAGGAEAATTAVAELDRTPLAHQGFAVELGLARAWAAAARGELSAARTHAREAADLARAREQHAYAARALHELCRLGDPATAAPELARLAGETDSPATAAPELAGLAGAETRAAGRETDSRGVDGPFVVAAAAHASALVARDGAAVLAAAERFAAEGALLVAAEAASAAAGLLRDAGRAASGRAAAARAAMWLEACEGARPPTLVGAPAAAELTPREREIALLAAGGASSRQIAGRLVLSVRTVDNHLQSAYRKLGVSRRQDLPTVIRMTYDHDDA